MSTKQTNKMKTAKTPKASKPSKKTETQHAPENKKKPGDASEEFVMYVCVGGVDKEAVFDNATCDAGMTAYMVSRLLESSDYDFSDFDVRFRRRPDLDTDDGAAIEIVVEKGVDGEEESYTIVEMFVTMAYLSFTDSVKEFDRHARLMSYINPPLKPEKTAKPSGKKASPAGSTKKRPVPHPLRVVKECLVKASKYRIPIKRFQIVADHVDTKSRKYVYELRFFQKDCSKNPGQPYEPAILRIGFGDDDFVRIAKRFDKIVEGLRFNTFDLKK